jgi:hypothetical protein
MDVEDINGNSWVARYQALTAQAWMSKWLCAQVPIMYPICSMHHAACVSHQMQGFIAPGGSSKQRQGQGSEKKSSAKGKGK